MKPRRALSRRSFLARVAGGGVSLRVARGGEAARAIRPRTATADQRAIRPGAGAGGPGKATAIRPIPPAMAARTAAAPTATAAPMATRPAAAAAPPARATATPTDPAGRGRPRTGISDSDSGPGADPAGRGRGQGQCNDRDRGEDRRSGGARAALRPPLIPLPKPLFTRLESVSGRRSGSDGKRADENRQASSAAVPSSPPSRAAPQPPA